MQSVPKGLLALAFKEMKRFVKLCLYSFALIRFRGFGVWVYM